MNLDLFGLSIALWVITEIPLSLLVPDLQMAFWCRRVHCGSSFGITPLEMAASPEKVLVGGVVLVTCSSS